MGHHDDDHMCKGAISAIMPTEGACLSNHCGWISSNYTSHGNAQAASEGSPASLPMTRQLIGNNDEVTDICFVGAPAAPTHLAVATNAPDIRLFDVATLGAAHCTLPRKDLGFTRCKYLLSCHPVKIVHSIRPADCSVVFTSLIAGWCGSCCPHTATILPFPTLVLLFAACMVLSIDRLPSCQGQLSNTCFFAVSTWCCGG